MVRYVRYVLKRCLLLLLIVSAAIMLLWRWHQALTPTHSETNSAQRVMLVVRTSRQFHSTRLKLLKSTWLKTVKTPFQIWVFSDNRSVSELFTDMPDVRVSVNGQCGTGHVNDFLCCRLDSEITTFFEIGLKWLCHFDDDNYVNTDRLAELLLNFSAQRALLIGRRSDAVVAGGVGGSSLDRVQFVVGGAGFCLSRAAVLKAGRSIVGGQLEKWCRRWRTPDDVTLARALFRHHGIGLTNSDLFHSHLERLSAINASNVAQQISVSYSLRRSAANVVSIEGFSQQSDPTRFRSLHCFLNKTRDCFW